MNKRKFGWTGLDISALGLGTWAMGSKDDWQFGWQPQDEKESAATIRHAAESGVNWIDTSPIFGFGRSEEVIGKAVRELKEKPFIATKCGLVWTQGKKIFGRLIKSSIIEELETSLRRLQTDTIDLYQIHWPNPDPDIEEAWSAIAQSVKEGKVRYAGVANFNVEQMKRLMPIHPIASLQVNYNMIYSGLQKDVLEFCASNNIALLAYNPLQKGLLSGNITKEWVLRLPKISPRLRDPEFSEPDFSANMGLVAGLDEIARRLGRTVSQISISWVLGQPGISSVIVGARSPSQIDNMLLPDDWRLSEEDTKGIDALLAERAASLNIG